MSVFKNVGSGAAGLIVGAGLYHALNTTHKDVPDYWIKESPTAFVGYFNQIIRPQDTYLFPCLVDKKGFDTMFNDIKLFSYNEADTIALQVFIAYFCTMYNETGGKFRSVSEIGTDEYFYDRKMVYRDREGREHWKASYNAEREYKMVMQNGQMSFVWTGKFKPINGLGNRKAGDQLAEWGIISKSDTIRINKWNSDDYPNDEPQSIKSAARNCDYYKYRGQGPIQITGRSNFVRFVKPALDKIGKDMERMASWELDLAFKDPRVYLPSLRNYLSANKKVIGSIKADNPDWDNFGHLISGKAKYDKFALRCQYLYDRILDEGFYRIMYPNAIIPDTTVVKDNVSHPINR